MLIFVAKIRFTILFVKYILPKITDFDLNHLFVSTYAVIIFTQKLLLFMNWSEFITFIENGGLGRRYSDYELANLIGVSREIIYKLRSGQTKRPQQATINKLEQGLNIKIDDSDPENITYRQAPVKEYEILDTPLNVFPVVATVHGGISPYYFDELPPDEIEYRAVPYRKKENCFLVRVEGDSMSGVVEEGDLVLADMDAPIRNGSTVIARLRDGRQIIKKYKALPGNMAMFYSANGDYEPIIVRFSEIEVMFRIVGIWQNLYPEEEELRDKQEMEKERKKKGNKKKNATTGR